jgi:HEAT repeat protein
VLLLELAEESPAAQELDTFLTDPDPQVRRTALAVLSEATEDWAEVSAVFASALDDPDDSVRAAAVELLRELREVLVPEERFAAALRSAGGHEEPGIRTAAVGGLWRHRLCTVDGLVKVLADPDDAVRCEAIAGLVSLDALDELDRAAADASSSVRLAVARGVAALGDPRGVTTLVALTGDPDVFVRAAALDAMVRTGCTTEAVEVAGSAMTDASWQVRQAAAAALSVADPAVAAAPLIAASRDENLDVRKAAVRAIGPWLPGRPEIRAALETALSDPDADVRAYARMGLAE